MSGISPGTLPIRGYAAEIQAAVAANPVVIVIGETGSGKTTQIAQILYEAGLAGKTAIAVTQPRRVAAISVARRVAEERGVELGQEVGYAVRFEERTSHRTRIKFLTDGMLMRELLDDCHLDRYDCVVLDEAHERSMNTDILFAVLKGVVRDRPSLRLVITSATLDGDKFSGYYGNCPVINVPGRAFPVDIIHSKEDHTKRYVDAAVSAALDIHQHKPPGDILVFLTGQAEVEAACAAISADIDALPADTGVGPLLVLPLYASLPMELQKRVFLPGGGDAACRRCIVSTNIAETSLTVAGVVYVVDSGMCKQMEHSSTTGMDSLEVTPISRVQAAQRAGRAGRTQPGKCYRLYPRKFFDNEMPNITLPEIQRTALVGVVLHLKSLPLRLDVLRFDYLDPPDASALRDGLRQLYVLDAIDIDGEITPLGKQLSTLPLEPSLGRALVAAAHFGCVSEMVTVAAMLSAENVFISFSRDSRGGRPPKNEHLTALMEQCGGDHLLMLALYNLWERQGCTLDFCKRMGLDMRSMRFAKDVRRQLESHASVLERSRPGTSARSGVGGDGAADRDSRREDAAPARKRKHEDSRDSSPPANRGPIERRLKQALCIGFANRIARRMRAHNGYRTMNSAAALAHLHPGSSTLPVDDDGLYPEWVLYHEFVSTSKPFLRQVCPVEESMVAPLLPQLRDVDVDRLSGGVSLRPETAVAGEPGNADTAASAAGAPKRTTGAAQEAARARYLARKAAGVATGKRVARSH